MRLLAGVVVVAACLGPQVSDEVVIPGLILPAGSTVPSIYDDPEEGPQIAANDGVDGVVPLLSGFAGGAPVAFWDFGRAPNFAQPLYVFFRRNAQNQLEPISHIPVVTAVPGDSGYSPYWRKTVVEVTGAYGGQLFTSVAAIQAGVTAGLLKSPQDTQTFINCPVVGKGVMLDVGGGAPAVAPGGRFYYDGLVGAYFDLGAGTLLADGLHVAEQNVYILRREGGEPLSEPLRGVDMDGDGDTHDTNDVLAFAPGAAGASPLCRDVMVTVPVGTESIDTTRDQTRSGVMGEADLFARGAATIVPIPGKVVAWQVTERLWNCPVTVAK
ncbi:MAG TPA: hypothetical protein VKE22_14960 [Haliangiales bacterium]|nr:hypothetical protein [Haliangiales bacterium]